MQIICLDLEGVLVPEIWIAFAEKTGIEQLKITTRDEPDYSKLMKYRINILKKNKLTINDIMKVISQIKPLDGALAFLEEIRPLTQVVILSDTFIEFAKPLMKQLNWPTILCNSLVIDKNNFITDFTIRQENGKKKAIEGFQSMGFKTFASGDSYNDISMIQTADSGCLFKAPEKILKEFNQLKLCTTYNQLLNEIKKFVKSSL